MPHIPPTEPPFRRILVPVDLSECSRAALRHARRLAGGDVKTITVLHVLDPMHCDWHADTTALQREAQAAARENVREFVAAEFPDGAPDTRIIEGNPVEAIVTHAEKIQADLVLVGTKGRTGLSRVLIGSVAERVVRHAPCPVMVIR